MWVIILSIQTSDFTVVGAFDNVFCYNFRRRPCCRYHAFNVDSIWWQYETFAKCWLYTVMCTSRLVGRWWNENLIFDVKMINSRFNLRSYDSNIAAPVPFFSLPILLDDVNIFIFFYWHLIRFTACVSGSFTFYAKVMLMISENQRQQKPRFQLSLHFRSAHNPVLINNFRFHHPDSRCFILICLLWEERKWKRNELSLFNDSNKCFEKVKEKICPFTTVSKLMVNKDTENTTILHVYAVESWVFGIVNWILQLNRLGFLWCS